MVCTPKKGMWLVNRLRDQRLNHSMLSQVKTVRWTLITVEGVQSLESACCLSSTFTTWKAWRLDGRHLTQGDWERSPNYWTILRSVLSLSDNLTINVNGQKIFPVLNPCRSTFLYVFRSIPLLHAPRRYRRNPYGGSRGDTWVVGYLGIYIHKIPLR